MSNMSNMLDMFDLFDLFDGVPLQHPFVKVLAAWVNSMIGSSFEEARNRIPRNRISQEPHVHEPHVYEPHTPGTACPGTAWQTDPRVQAWP